MTTPDSVSGWASDGASATWWRQLHASRFTGMKILSRPDTEQLTIADAALHLRLDSFGSPTSYDDELWVTAAIIAAREVCEGLTGLLLAPQDVEIALPGFPVDWHWGDVTQSGVSLMTGPLLGVTSVNYSDGTTSGIIVDDSVFEVDDYMRPPVLSPRYGQVWPTAVQSRNSVKIRFRAGYNTPGDSPQDQPLPYALRAAMLLVLGHLYENRENTTALKLEMLPMGVTALTERYRIRTSMA